MIFGTVVDEADNATKHITVFKKSLGEVKSDLSNSDTRGLSKIATAVKSVGLQAVWTEIKVAALNATISFGLSLAIGWAVSAITEWVNKEKEAAEQAEKARQAMEEQRKRAIESIQAYKDETQSINDLLTEYIKLVSSTKDYTTIKSDLSSIQEQIVEKYGEEASAIDLVNGKLSDNIELLLKQEEARNTDWLRENSDSIKTAQSYFEIERAPFSLLNFHGDSYQLKKENVGAAKIEAKYYYDALKEAFEDLNISDFIQENLGDAGYSFTLGFSLKDNLDPEKQLEVINTVIDAYEQLDKNTRNYQQYYNLMNGENYQNLIALRTETQEYLAILNDAQSKESANTNIESLIGNPDDLKKYKDNMEEITRLTQVMNDASNAPSRRFSAMLDLNDTKRDIQEIVGLYPSIREFAEGAIAATGQVFTATIADEQALIEQFNETLESTHKTALGNIDKLESAMASAIKGEGLGHDSAWELLNLDTEHYLNASVDSAGKYHLALEDIIKVKDHMIEQNKTLIQQDLELAQSEMRAAQDELAMVNKMIKQQASGNTRPNESLTKRQYELTKSIEAFGDEIERDTLLIKEYDSHLGNLANTEKMLQAQVDALKESQEALKNEISDLNTQADNLLKAQEGKIDQIVDGFEEEEKALEDDKQLLQEQLEILEEQKQQIEDIISQYEQVADIVSTTISDQIDEIEKNRQAIEDYYNELIDKLKEENEERSDALDYAEKLAALENAKNNKVRVYGTGTGWTYAVDQDALAKAQNALLEAENEKAIKELEKARDEATSGYDAQIKEFEEYGETWEDIIKEISTEEDELLAQQILGSDWREKIAQKDTKVITTFRNEYRNYTSQLKNLTDNEIKSLNDSIKAKSDEIETKKKQIQTWKDYKSEVQNTVQTIKNNLDGYNNLLNQVMLNENSTYEQRQANLSNFAKQYGDIISQVSSKNKDLEKTTNQISTLVKQIDKLPKANLQIETNIGDVSNQIADFLERYYSAVTSINSAVKAMSTAAESFGNFLTGSSGKSAASNILDQSSDLIKKSIASLRGSYSDGGVINYTGLANVHGTPSHSETAFSAAQSKDLWNMVRSGEFSSLAAEKAVKGIGDVLRTMGGTTSNSNSRIININGMTIKADNPQQFHKQFMSEIEKYWDVTMTESPIM